ncbi:predicted protein [Nematostella vectensis]|uniref:Uncharacterized protein n=1 Tax=Nematostella vectensis TaxID=45351 RepID=A7RT31_NEMVE|nr:predicted protein [Nematostella vectensis]|eukprot:XP_001637382.1 predicted protein [Nematostella vectensis]
MLLTEIAFHSYSTLTIPSLLTPRVFFHRHAQCSMEGPVLKMLFDGYDKEARPNWGGRPVEVRTDAIVEAFGNIQEANMYWTDKRLAGKLNLSITLTVSAASNACKPDPYCYNARQSNMMLEDKDVNSRLSIDPDGKIFYSRGVSIVASCEMDLHDFPLDTQNCYLKFGSYAFTDTDIFFRWNNPNKLSRVQKSDLAQFHLAGYDLITETGIYEEGNYTTVKVIFKMNRRVGYYIIQAYCPDVLIVVLSWIIFWMDVKDMGDRMALGITTILTIMFLLGAVNASMPKVSYPKALDWYLMVSFAFVFLTLIESMIVFLLTPQGESEKPKKTSCLTKRVVTMLTPVLRRRPNSHVVTTPNNHELNNISPTDAALLNPEDGGGREGPNGTKACWDDHTGHVKESKCAGYRVDQISRVLFPLAFVFYNVAYWYTYLERIPVLGESDIM